MRDVYRSIHMMKIIHNKYVFPVLTMDLKMIHIAWQHILEQKVTISDLEMCASLRNLRVKSEVGGGGLRCHE